MLKMNWFAKLGLVLGGYAAAVLAAFGAVYINQLLTPDAVSNASAGMSAFGDFILFSGVCGVLAIFPTGLGLFFLIRRVYLRLSPR
jgi:hypothetical protein